MLGLLIVFCAHQPKTVNMLSLSFRHGVTTGTHWKHNDGAMEGNVQIKGRNILIRSPYLVTEGEKSDTLIFFRGLQKKVYQNKYLVVLFHVFWVGRCTGDPIIAHRKS